MPLPVIEAVVVDVLGTLVDEPAGLRAGIRTIAPSVDETGLEELLGLWQRHIEQEQQRILRGDRAFASSEVLDREAAELVAVRAGVSDPAVLSELAAAGQRLAPWPDAVRGLARLAERFPLIGLSNASRSALLRLGAHAGLRWHQALSAESAGAYKPAAEVYRLAVELTARPPERLLMVAAHAWDLRGAREIGMRTAYVARPVGDPPAPGERFDLHADGLDDLADQLAAV
ncbi:haloacid dehalogenase type II [Saccharopolyspora sp. 5N708]|uniref:haloacid dehalogenase type II n=1 Tax=Saccharopolyspora sp. 5N708 TaxID=3457424 RepID=UPI003FD3DB5F